ncbi:hypothetical protein J5N97_008844 [Dioscorea zingiberensis]|uniref:UspA domain-containing protein n=1 Tax=Dioscorea zingiberensis TaxID=325984 RepID=A0A9D5CWX2_9LILI|nr:hypothetical protein J5N97_008844 [Dioscorea zingiberensis]
MESLSQASPGCSSLPDDLTLAEDQDAFLRFVEYARSMISPGDRDLDGSDGAQGPPWSWIVSRIIKTCVAYSSGVTPAILLSDLFQVLHSVAHRFDSFEVFEFAEGTNITMLCLGDICSSSTIDMYLHRRYCHLVGPDNGILKKGREILLTGCRLRTAVGGSGQPRLLPTEYLVIVLNEDQDEDAMLLGAQFCTDSFSSISIDAVKNGASYSFYARIDSIGPPEAQDIAGVQRQQITLVDNDGFKLNFLLWGEQVLLSNLFSVGSMLALDRPFVAHAADCNTEINHEISLEYGSATQLYLVPFIQHEEQVLLASTQMRYQGSSLSNMPGQSQSPKLSQVSLPLNPQGSIDFSSCPFRSYVIDLRDKTAGISLYGSVSNIKREHNTAGTVFSLIIEDTTGAITAKLHFVSSWSLGRLGVGHMVYISGLSCSMTTKNLLELSWFEKDNRASLVNISCLSALLNSSCLHRLSYLSDISDQGHNMHICRVCLDCIEHYFIHSTICHSLCGQHVNEMSDGSVVCSFCNCSCDGELLRSFHLSVTLADQSAKVFAWCTGQTAAELLQISPDEFFALPEDEQAMYLCTLGTDRFMVSLVYCKKQSSGSDQENTPEWEVPSKGGKKYAELINLIHGDKAAIKAFARQGRRVQCLIKCLLMPHKKQSWKSETWEGDTCVSPSACLGIRNAAVDTWTNGNLGTDGLCVLGTGPHAFSNMSQLLAMAAMLQHSSILYQSPHSVSLLIWFHLYSLVVGRETMAGDRVIGVAVDFSPCSKAALRWAIEHVVRAGDHIILVYVQKDVQYDVGEVQLWEATGSPLIPLSELSDPGIIKKYGVKPDSETLDIITTAARQKEIVVVMKIFWGDPREKIIEAIDNIPLSSLVIGSRGLGKIKRVLLGSVSNYVVNHASCPVTVVKSTDHDV